MRSEDEADVGALASLVLLTVIKILHSRPKLIEETTLTPYKLHPLALTMIYLIKSV